MFEAGQNIKKKFPELAEQKNKTEIIVSAILQNEQLGQKINKVYQFEDCLGLIVLANLCWTNFPYDYDAAFNCWLYFLGLFDICAIFSE